MIGYDFEVVYKKGIANVVANTLSRKPYGELQAITIVQSGLVDTIHLTWFS